MTAPDTFALVVGLLILAVVGYVKVVTWIGGAIAEARDKAEWREAEPEYVEVGRLVWLDGRPYYGIALYESPVIEADRLLRGESS